MKAIGRKKESGLRLWDPGGRKPRQAPLSMGFSGQEDWSGWPFPPAGNHPDPGIEPRSPALQADSLPSVPPGKSPLRRKLGTLGHFLACTWLSPISQNQRVWTTLTLQLVNTIRLKHWSSPVLERILSWLFQQGNVRKRVWLFPTRFILLECHWKAFEETSCWLPKMSLRGSWLNVSGGKYYQCDY